MPSDSNEGWPQEDPQDEPIRPSEPPLQEFQEEEIAEEGGEGEESGQAGGSGDGFSDEAPEGESAEQRSKWVAEGVDETDRPASGGWVSATVHDGSPADDAMDWLGSRPETVRTKRPGTKEQPILQEDVSDDSKPAEEPQAEADDRHDDTPLVNTVEREVADVDAQSKTYGTDVANSVIREAARVDDDETEGSVAEGPQTEPGDEEAGADYEVGEFTRVPDDGSRPPVVEFFDIQQKKENPVPGAPRAKKGDRAASAAESAKTINEPQMGGTEFAPPPKDVGTGRMRRATSRYDRDKDASLVVGLSPWKLDEKKLGAGGMGEVRKGTHEFSGLEVAIKTVLVTQGGREGSSTNNKLTSLMNEAKALAQFQHPNIVRLLDFQEIERRPSKHDKLSLLQNILDDPSTADSARATVQRGKDAGDRVAALLGSEAIKIHEGLERLEASAPLEYMMVMEFMKGGSLTDRMTKTVEYQDGTKEKKILPMDAREAVGIIQKVGLGLQAVHKKGILHRDIKPDNIMFDENGVPKLGDFGLAFGLQQKAEGIAGSPYYLAPEQTAPNVELDARTDVYLLAATLYHALTGRWRLETELAGLFEAPPGQLKPMTVLKQLQRSYRVGTVNELAENLGARGKDLSAVVMKAMSYDRDLRYASVEEFCADLARWANDELVEARLRPNVGSLKNSMGVFAGKLRAQALRDSEALPEDAAKEHRDEVRADLDRMTGQVERDANALPYTKQELRDHWMRNGGKRKIGVAAGFVGAGLFALLFGNSIISDYQKSREAKAQIAARAQQLSVLREGIDSGVAFIGSRSRKDALALSQRVESAYLFAVENKETVPEAKDALAQLESQRTAVQAIVADVTERDRVLQILDTVPNARESVSPSDARLMISAYRAVKGSDSSYGKQAQENLQARLDLSVARLHRAVSARYASIASIDTPLLAGVRDEVNQVQAIVASGRDAKGNNSYQEEDRTLRVWDEALAAAYQGRTEEALLRVESGVSAPPLQNVLISASEAELRRFRELASREAAALEERAKHGSNAIAQYQVAARVDPSWALLGGRLQEVIAFESDLQSRLATVKKAAQVSSAIVEYRAAAQAEDFTLAFSKLSEVYGIWQEQGVLDLMQETARRDKTGTSDRVLDGVAQVMAYGKRVQTLYTRFYRSELDGDRDELNAGLTGARSDLENALRPQGELPQHHLADKSYSLLVAQANDLLTAAEDANQRRYGEEKAQTDARHALEAQGREYDRQLNAHEIDYNRWKQLRDHLGTVPSGRSSGQKK